MTDHDTLDLLTRARPTTEALDDTWPAAEREAVWRGAVAEAAAPARPARPSRPRRTAWLAAAAAVSALAVVPVVVDGGDAAARAEILRLAVVAAGAEGPAIAPGTVLHVRGTSLQQNSSVFGDGGRSDHEYENWVRWDGATWVETTRPSAGWTERAYYPAPRRADFGTPTPAFVAALPDDADELRAYLDETVSGSNSHEEAVFVAITDLAHSHLLDPATFAVALEVLADVDGVRTRDVVVAGRDAVEISRDRFVIGLLGRTTITVDRATGQVLGTASSDPGGTSESTTTLLETVDAVPQRVRDDLRRYGNGSRVCADGYEPFDAEPCR